MIDLFLSGGFMMWPMLLGLIAVLVVGGRAALDMAGGRRAEADVRSAADAVLFWGGFSALLGLMGTLVGIAQAARAISLAGGASAGLIWSGIGITLITTLFGLGILLLAMIVWYAVRLTARRRAAPGAMAQPGLPA